MLYVKMKKHPCSPLSIQCILLLLAFVTGIHVRMFRNVDFWARHEYNTGGSSLDVMTIKARSTCETMNVLKSNSTTMFSIHEMSDISSPINNDAVLVIATVPLLRHHLLALWSQLECLVDDINHVVISAPHWAKPVLDIVLGHANKQIPHIASKHVSVEANFFDNDRYDVGLWCDALEGIQQRFDKVLLLNDSILILRKFNGVINALRSTDYDLVSLNHNKEDQNEMWVESVFRGFNAKALQVFMNHSCLPKTQKTNCSKFSARSKRKRCIVEYHEIRLASVFSSQNLTVLGLYRGTVPGSMRSTKTSTFPTWVAHVQFWKEVLVEQYDFPALKVKMLQLLHKEDTPLVSACTQFLNTSLLDYIDLTGGAHVV